MQNTCTNFCTTIAAAINPDCKDVHILRGYLNNADEASSIHTTEQTSFTKVLLFILLLRVSLEEMYFLYVIDVRDQSP